MRYCLRRTPSRGRWMLWAALLLVGCRSGVSSTKPNAAEGQADEAAETTIERGPVKVTVRVAPHPIRLSDEPTLSLTIEAEEGVQVEKPPFGEAIGEFVIRDFREPLPSQHDGRQVIQQLYTLEPTRSGPQTVAPLRIVFVDNRPNGDGQEHVVETEALELEVVSVIADEALSLDDLKAPAEPVELPEPPSRWMTWTTVSLLVVLLAGGVIWGLTRRRRVIEATTLSPQEQAYLELNQLLEQNLAESDVKLFYVQLTAVVRRYIERTTGVHAPEQTTEEFLREIGGSDVFSGDERRRLKAFLESADLVKFAAHEPTAADVEQTFDRAKAFIGLQMQEEVA